MEQSDVNLDKCVLDYCENETAWVCTWSAPNNTYSGLRIGWCKEHMDNERIDWKSDKVRASYFSDLRPLATQEDFWEELNNDMSR